MMLVVDDSVDHPIAERLRADGHDVLYAAEVQPRLEDDVILTIATERRTLLLTADKDFGELAFRTGRAAHGVLLVRLSGLSPGLKARLVSEAVRAHGPEMLRAFTVISPGLVRVRKLTEGLP